ncbi:MAG: hypothetical protein QOF48_3618, partial [Verrucomicrobiota bacterium]
MRLLDRATERPNIMKQKVEKGVKADTVPQVDKLEVIWVTGEKLSIEDLRRRDTAEILEKIQ